jgi:cell division protein FtsZ
LAGDSLSLIETFKRADEVLLNAVRGISDLINNTGHINADFADVRTVMANKGMALMGTGIASGQDRAIKAATEAISSPLLEDISINGATGIIINITGSQSLTMHETNEAVTLIMEAADEDAEIIFGTVIDDALGEDLKVTVIATGLGVEKHKIVNVPTRQNHEPAAKAAYHAPVVNSYEEKPIQVTAPQQEQIVAREVEVKTSAPVHTAPIVTVEAEQAPAPKSNFYSNLQEAASVYQKKMEASDRPTIKNEPEQNSIQSQYADKRDSGGRVRAIAERLGFISFDEEELDTPTFLRKEESKNNNTRNVEI